MCCVESGGPQSRTPLQRDPNAGPLLKRKENARRNTNHCTNFEAVDVTGIKRTKMCGPKFKRYPIVRGVYQHLLATLSYLNIRNCAPQSALVMILCISEYYCCKACFGVELIYIERAYRPIQLLFIATHDLPAFRSN